MEPSDKTEFMKILSAMSELYGKALSKLLIKIYWYALKSFELVGIRQAFDTHIRNPDGGQFFPKPADIIRLIEGGGETRALHAWASVARTIEQVGIYQTVVFDDPLIHAVLENMGGWIDLCSITNERLPFYAREFQKRYMGYVNKKPERYPKSLWGLFERDNAQNGYIVAPPILIGNALKAKAVFQSGGGTPLLTQSLEKSLSSEVLRLSRAKFEKEED